MTERPEERIRRGEDGFYRPAEETPEEVALLVGVHLLSQRPGGPTELADLEELERLAETAGARVVGRLEQRRSAPDVRTLVGHGKTEQLKNMVGALGANLVVFDNDLSPAQGRNLEKQLEVRVIDRTELILDIFARHARTRQSRLQVALAQYEYLLPRLAKMWKHLERQGGGIGTRGPGETQIETDRRLIRNRITQLKRDLVRVDRHMQTQHKQRRGELRVALVGYTNAGKSSLMNRVTDAGVYVQDQLFATLDATTRRVRTADDHVFLLTDTVGFIRKLPHHLVESFRATLSEVAEADVLLHVVDGAEEDLEGKMEAVEGVLSSVTGDRSEEQDSYLVFNKIDTVEADRRRALQEHYPEALLTSARTGEGIDGLLERIAARLRREERRMVVRLPHGAGSSLAALHRLADVSGIEYGHDGHTTVTLRVGRENYGRVLQLEHLEVLEVASRG